MKVVTDDSLRFWSLWDILHAFLLYIVCGFGLYILIKIFNELLSLNMPEELRNGIIGALSTTCAAYYLLKEYPVDFRRYGFGRSDILKSLRWGILFGITLGALSFPYKTILGGNEIPEKGVYVSIENGILYVLICIIFATVLAPIVEELVFRLCIFRIFKNRFSIAWGHILTAILFSVGHAAVLTGGQFALFFIKSVILSHLYNKTRFIAPCIIAHSIWNMTWFFSMYAYESGTIF